MTNNSGQCLTLLYDMVETMTIANGYRYDWLVNKGGDKFFKASIQPKMYIRMGNEDNVDDGGAIGSNQYIDELQFTLIAKVNFNKSDVLPQDVEYEQTLALSAMRDDIKDRFNSAAYMCDARRADPVNILFKARHLKYNGSVPAIEINEAKFSTMRVTANITVKYESDRGL